MSRIIMVRMARKMAKGCTKNCAAMARKMGSGSGSIQSHPIRSETRRTLRFEIDHLSCSAISILQHGRLYSSLASTVRATLLGYYTDVHGCRS